MNIHFHFALLEWRLSHWQEASWTKEDWNWIIEIPVVYFNWPWQVVWCQNATKLKTRLVHNPFKSIINYTVSSFLNETPPWPNWLDEVYEFRHFFLAKDHDEAINGILHQLQLLFRPKTYSPRNEHNSALQFIMILYYCVSPVIFKMFFLNTSF